MPDQRTATGRPAAGRRPAPDPLWRTVVGAVLREERHRQGRTLQHVADAAGVSVPYLSEVERGRKEASSEILAAVAGALDLRLVDLLGRAHALLAGAFATLDLTTWPTGPAAAPHGPSNDYRASVTLLAA
ncbi:helix-turn-helix domain-containing protein [Kineosporia sp. R_H_3]|uniref:helix-turn-helix domain-containing protein n=1 Tax=Kineosporia sp. R_H_3 TaxID=1961848 RepID=UPI0026F473D9|nr:helix-turn-helix transcriptional regulator [Kineosporia sp. R_H_3]